MTARPSRAGKKRRKAREWWIDPSDENVYGTRQEAYFAGNRRPLRCSFGFHAWTLVRHVHGSNGCEKTFYCDPCPRVRNFSMIYLGGRFTFDRCMEANVAPR